MMRWKRSKHSRQANDTASDHPDTQHALCFEKRDESLFFSAVAGIAVGVFYGAVNVKSPAPPMIAIVGLLGMLAGEHAIAFIRHLIAQFGH
jgi:XapX domain-containing protein